MLLLFLLLLYFQTADSLLFTVDTHICACGLLCLSSHQLSITVYIPAGQGTYRQLYPLLPTAVYSPNPCPTYFSIHWQTSIKVFFFLNVFLMLFKGSSKSFEGTVLLRSDIFLCCWGFMSALYYKINPSTYCDRNSFVLVGKELLMMELLSICVLQDGSPVQHHFLAEGDFIRLKKTTRGSNIVLCRIPFIECWG